MVTLAIDAGTSALKILHTTSGGDPIALDRIPHLGIDIDGWMSAIAASIRERGDGDRIDRIAITGQMHGLLTREADAWGEPMPWTDQRGASVLPDLLALINPGTQHCLGGPLASGFLGVSLAWIAANDRERWSRIRSVHLPKDALVWALTGAHVTDPTDAAGSGLYDIAAGTWSRPVLDAIGIPTAWLPRIVPSGSPAGEVSASVASNIGVASGTPVVVAGGDAAVGAVGGGVTHPGDALVLLSSGAQVILPDLAFAPDDEGRWYTWPSAIPDHGAPYLRIGTLLNAGNAVAWANTRVAEDDSVASQPTSLIALPHLLGERAPAGDAGSRGAFLGMTSSTTCADLRRAVLEGVAYGLRHVLETMTGGGVPPARLRLGGGGARQSHWPQIIADVLGIPIEPLPDGELTVRGAAMLATGEVIPRATGPRIEPSPSMVTAYDARYAVYREAMHALAPISRALAALEDTTSCD